ncbi:hypothetical protein [Kurthia sp. Dielmo]|uniref:hypothetical protein n=1 Tax=Kurthia sp. Dielmo TaxID=1033738 RepID=UPI00111EB5DE|nr:hypothetical protein [Kurthia sp. Dielmo]
MMKIDPNGKLAQILGGALINAVSYIAKLIAKYGTKKFKKEICFKELGITMGRGALSGAMGLGLVSKSKKAGELSDIAGKFLSGHIAPAAYLVGNFGDFSKGSFSENQILSYFGKTESFI